MRLSARRGAAVCGAAGAANLSRNESGHPGRQCRRLPMCPPRRAARTRSPNLMDVQSRGAVSTHRACAATSRPRPMAARRHSFGERPKNSGARAPKTAPHRLRIGIARQSCIGRSPSSRRLPRLAEERHDLALALRPCEVEGRLAGIVSECQIRASFEQTRGDREVAVDCGPMQCCPAVVLLMMNDPLDQYGGRWSMAGVLRGRASRSRLTFVALTLALDSRRSRTHPSLSLDAAIIKAVRSKLC